MYERRPRLTGTVAQWFQEEPSWFQSPSGRRMRKMVRKRAVRRV